MKALLVAQLLLKQHMFKIIANNSKKIFIKKFNLSNPLQVKCVKSYCIQKCFSALNNKNEEISLITI